MNYKTIVLLFGVILICTKYKNEKKELAIGTEKSSATCRIENPDPEGYLLKICKYLNENKKTIYPGKAPDAYIIKSITEGSYTLKGITYDVLIIRLDCCGTGDLAYFDKKSKKVLAFSPGDLLH